MLRVSVLMPCYNAAATLSDAFGSLQRQSLVDFEVVAVDDGSQDDTAAVLQMFAESDPRFSWLSTRHAGIIASLNAGLASCQAPLIARMDADDRAHPDRLMLQAEYLEAHPETSVVSSRVTAFPSESVRQGFAVYLDWLNGLLTDDQIRREIFVESPLPHPSWMLRREPLEKLGGYQDHGWAEDYDLLLRLYLDGARFHKLGTPLLEWREHSDRLTRTDSRYSLENFLRAKAHYLCLGPLIGRDAVIIWGAGMMGRRLGKQLARIGAPLSAYVDVDPLKIGRTRRGLPVIPPEVLRAWWDRFTNPILLAAVGTRGARPIIRRRLDGMGFREGQDWWLAA